jgi:hypothetical protein
MNMNYKKTLKFVTLLITSLLIATVSAQTYVYMYINGSVTIGSEQLVWIAGASAPGDISIAGGTVTLDLDVQPDFEQNFTECLFLKNQDGSDHNMTISITTAASAATFDWFYADIYENSTSSWVYVDTLDITNSADSYETYTTNTPLVSGGFYRFTFALKAKTGTSGTHDFDLKVTYE